MKKSQYIVFEVEDTDEGLQRTLALSGKVTYEEALRISRFYRNQCRYVAIFYVSDTQLLVTAWDQ